MNFIQQAIAKRVEYLRGRCALYRCILKNQTRAHWGQGREEQRAKSLAETEAQKVEADKTLADFIAEQRPHMPGDWMPDGHGLLCWDTVYGDLPIRDVTCDCEAGHAGPHRESITGAEWTDGNEVRAVALGNYHLSKKQCLWERTKGDA